MENTVPQPITRFRNSNIELFRIVLMLMIVLHHFIVHGMELENLDTNSMHVTKYTPYLFFLNGFLVVAVNCYILISGFYGIRVRAITVLSFIAQTSFYSIFLFCLQSLIVKHTIDTKAIVSGLFPLSRALWWFITTYFGLYIISPLLNLANLHLSKARFTYVLIAFAFINCILGFVFQPANLGVLRGYSLTSFIFIYLLGQYLSKYGVLRMKRPLLMYVACSVLVFLMSYLVFLYWKQNLSFRIFSYSNPVVILSSVSLFLVFQKFSINSRFINKIAGSVFGIYLIHEHPGVGPSLYKIIAGLQHSSTIPGFFLKILLIGIVVMIVCLVIEYIRAAIFKPFVNYVNDKFTLYRWDMMINGKR